MRCRHSIRKQNKMVTQSNVCVFSEAHQIKQGYKSDQETFRGVYLWRLKRSPILIWSGMLEYMQQILDLENLENRELRSLSCYMFLRSCLIMTSRISLRPGTPEE